MLKAVLTEKQDQMLRFAIQAVNQHGNEVIKREVFIGNINHLIAVDAN